MLYKSCPPIKMNGGGRQKINLFLQRATLLFLAQLFSEADTFLFGKAFSFRVNEKKKVWGREDLNPRRSVIRSLFLFLDKKKKNAGEKEKEQPIGHYTFLFPQAFSFRVNEKKKADPNAESYQARLRPRTTIFKIFDFYARHFRQKLLRWA
ncbi:Uncharacterised protein [uncultured archaeon]|nr:Uncharacterised protein [uncultured archaeon]